MFKVNLPVVFLREQDKFIAYSPALDISTSGDTFEQAKKRFTELVGIFFEEINKKGTTQNVLENLGWRKVRKEWQSPSLVSQDREMVTIPV